MTDSELLKELKSRKKLVIVIGLITAVITAFYFIQKPCIYTSSTSFFIDDDDGTGLKFTENNIDPNVFMKATNGNRIYHLAKSSEMRDYLINRFNLYSHYQINQNNANAYAMANSRLMSNIILSRAEYNSLLITVQDEDNIMAANIANEMFYKLDSMNKEFIIESLGLRIRLYEQLLGNIKSQSIEQADQLKELIDECKTLVFDKKISKDQNALIANLNIKLTTLTAQLSTVNDDLMRTLKIYEMASANLQKDNLPGLHVINKAMPDLHSPFITGVLWTISFAFVAAFITMSIIILFHEYRFSWRTIFS